MLTQSIVAAVAAVSLFLDGANGFKSKVGDAARRNQERAAKVVQEAEAARHLYARGLNATNSTTPKRFLTNATEREIALYPT